MNVYPHAHLEDAMSSDFPRRHRVDLLTPAELQIRDAVFTVEDMGADPLLTEAVVLLQQARDKVADYVDRGLVAR